jgi:hypothetical protein
VVALLVGLALGLVVGRSTAPGIGDRIASVRDDARRNAAAQRVIVLHDEAGIPASSAGDNGAELVLTRTRTELDDEFERAPWLARSQHDDLVRELDALAAMTDRSSTAFSQAAEKLAEQIDATFGIAD